MTPQPTATRAHATEMKAFHPYIFYIENIAMYFIPFQWDLLSSFCDLRMAHEPQFGKQP